MFSGLRAAQDARSVAAEPRIGFCDAGSSIMYAHRIGLGRARTFPLLNATMTADEALAPAGLAAGSTRAFGEMRRPPTSVEEQPLDVQLKLEARALARSAAAAEAREGLPPPKGDRPNPRAFDRGGDDVALS